MLVRKGNCFELYPYKVRYTNSQSDNENNVIRWATPSKEWWTDIEKHEHITVHEFIGVEMTEEMEKRFEEIRFMPEDFTDVYIDYVINGNFPSNFPKTHPFMLLKTQKENELQDTILLDLDFRQSLTEMGL